MVSSVTKVFIVISSLIMHLGCKVVKFGSTESNINTNEKKGNWKKHTSVSATNEKNEEEYDYGVGNEVKNKEETSTALQNSNIVTTTETILSSSVPTYADQENTNRKDYSYTESSKISLTLAIALILVALCVGAVVTAVILCCTQEKWTSHFPSQRAHHASKSSTERSDAVIVMSDIHIPTSGSFDVEPSYNENLSAYNIPVNLGDKNLKQRVPLESNYYEIVFEHGHQRNSLEHPYGCVSAGSDVNPIANNGMEDNEMINKEGNHEYFLIALNEHDGKNATEGSDMKMVEEDHDYFVLTPHEPDGENLTEGNEMGMGENNHDYFVLSPHEPDGETSL
ncbi:hypothetical protein CHS0354_040338 [Potamilus streckersoni]|uniref:Uncharacterized protein n=1 Tax=Potamilus streckersoni TaxID=2493646 RepID=A0AAE0S152_9BIVA|nr:hypothetical protein CHS0354_040338 [Potamilus streckersoni]